jgi:hypothetical protein
MQSICGFAWGLALVLRRGTVKSDEAGASRCVMGRTVAGLNRHTSGMSSGLTRSGQIFCEDDEDRERLRRQDSSVPTAH